MSIKKEKNMNLKKRMGVPQTPSVLPVKHTIMKTQKISL
jgi:hypothetical protein